MPRHRRSTPSSSGRRRSSAPSGSACSRSSSTGSATAGASTCWETARPLPTARRGGSRRRCRARMHCRRRRRGLQRRRNELRHRSQRPRGADPACGNRLAPAADPGAPAELLLRGLELAHLSPLGEWHYKTASRDSFVDVSKAESLLGWRATKSNVETLAENYDWYAANRGRMKRGGPDASRPLEPAGAAWLKKVS